MNQSLRGLLFLSMLSLIVPAPLDAQSSFTGTGRVVAIDASIPAVTLDHGPIPGLMPAMRMQFPVQDAGLLRELTIGTAVQFALERRGNQWVIVRLARGQVSSSAAFPAPTFTLPALSGGNIRLADLRGKVVLVNFWATWCGPCRTEMPALEDLYRRYRNRGFEILAINLDRLSRTSVEAFVQEVRTTFPVVLDPTWAAATTYKVVGLPTTYLIDQAGNIVVREVGERNWTDDPSRAAVERLLHHGEAGRPR